MQTLSISTGPGTHLPLIGYRDQPRFSLQGIALVVAAHALALTLLATLNVVPLAQTPQTPLSALMVDMISAATPAPVAAQPKPQAIEPAPVPQRQPKPIARQVLSAPAEAPSSIAEPARETARPAAVASLPASTNPAAVAPVTQPRFDADYLSNPAPAYPPLARRMGEEGKVVLRVFVDPAGRASQIELNAGSGSPRLDQAAQDAVWRWRFVPARRGDEAVGAWVLVPIVFNLKG